MEMKISSAARKISLSVFTLLIIFSTTILFHYTQSSYKSFAIGKGYFERKEYTDALPYLISSFEMEPHNIKAASLLLWCYERLNMKEEARDILNLILESRPEDLKITEELADAYYGLSDYGRAEELYRKILSKKERKETKRKLAEVLIWQKKYNDAKPILEEMIKESPRDFELTERLADIYSWTKKYDRAIELYGNLQSHGYRADDITLKLADLLRYAGRNEEAAELYRRYLNRKR